MKKKAKPLTKLQKLERDVQNMKFAIYRTDSDFQEVYGLLVIYREFLNSPEYNKYTAKNALNGIFSNLININTNLMQEAGIED